MITKKCNVQNCNNKSWSKGVCKLHGPRTSLTKGNSLYKKKEKVTKEVVSKIVERNRFFNTIWSNRPHVCEHCGKNLGSEARTYMFDHLLEKQKYKKLEFEEDNILLVCLECHDQKTRGIISEKYQEKINFVITKFNVS